MEQIDINLLLALVENMSGIDVLNYCSSNKHLNRLCKKYSDVIWRKKLLKDFGAKKEDIFGDSKYYYFGLLNNEGSYYFFDINVQDDSGNLVLDRFEEISKEDAKWDISFFVPGKPKGEHVFKNLR
jgi:hypothetical protein